MSFFAELKRRNVLKMATAYILLGWLVIEMSSTILPTFDAPRWVVQTLTFLVILGFPIALFLAWAFELTPEGIRTEASAHTPETISKAKGQRLNYLIFSLIGLALGFLFVDRFMLEGAAQRSAAVPTSPQGLQWVSVVMPANRPVAIIGAPSRALALSPDGTQIVYTGTNLDLPSSNPGGRSQLQLRTLASRNVSDLPGTRDARQPFFSPDGQWVAFFTSQGELKKIALAGGNPITVAEGINGSSWGFGVWTPEGNIIFGSYGGGLRQVSAEGGAVIELATLDASRDEISHMAATLVPSRRAVLFTSATTRDARIEAFMPDTGERRVVLENAYNPHLLSTGHLLFQRDASLMLALFDTQNLQLAGPAISVTEAVRDDDTAGLFPLAELAVAANGTLAYVPANDTVRELGLVSRDGSFAGLDLPPNAYARPRLAPDGRTLSYTVSTGGDSEIHGFDLQRGSTTRLTLDDEYMFGMEWHPDGRSLALTDVQDGYYLQQPDGSRTLLVSQPEGSFQRSASWSPDGTQLAFTRQTGALLDIWVVTLGATPGDTPTVQPLLASADEEYSPAFSPDGRWLAYVSNVSGRREIYLQRYPEGERLAVSTEGGQGPVWSADGSELYFVGTSESVSKMLAVTMTPAGDSLQLSRPAPLFPMIMPGVVGVVMQYAGANLWGPDYDVLPDGRFVMIRNTFSSTDSREIVLVQNWFEEVARLAPVEE